MQLMLRADDRQPLRGSRESAAPESHPRASNPQASPLSPLADRLASAVRTAHALRRAALPSPPSLMLITDPGPDPDDVKALLIAATMHRRRRLTLRAVVCNGGHQARERARLARCILDHLGEHDIPVGHGSEGKPYAPQPHEYAIEGFADVPDSRLAPGGPLILRTLRAAAPGSLTVVCISSLRDLADAMAAEPELVLSRVAQVAVQGGLVWAEGAEGGGRWVPDTSVNNEFDPEAAAAVYDFCFERGLPMTVTSRNAVPLLPMQLANSFAQRTACPVLAYLAASQALGLEGLWRKLCAGGLPARCTKQWYFETFCGVDADAFRRAQLDALGADARISAHLNGFVKPYDVVALMTVLPGTAEQLFTAAAATSVRGTRHLLLLEAEHCVHVGGVLNLLRDTYHLVALRTAELGGGAQHSGSEAEEAEEAADVADVEAGGGPGPRPARAPSAAGAGAGVGAGADVGGGGGGGLGARLALGWLRPAGRWLARTRRGTADGGGSWRSSRGSGRGIGPSAPHSPSRSFGGGVQRGPRRSGQRAPRLSSRSHSPAARSRRGSRGRGAAALGAAAGPTADGGASGRGRGLRQRSRQLSEREFGAHIGVRRLSPLVQRRFAHAPRTPAPAEAAAPAADAGPGGGTGAAGGDGGGAADARRAADAAPRAPAESGASDARAPTAVEMAAHASAASARVSPVLQPMTDAELCALLEAALASARALNQRIALAVLLGCAALCAFALTYAFLSSFAGWAPLGAAPRGEGGSGLARSGLVRAAEELLVLLAYALLGAVLLVLHPSDAERVRIRAAAGAIGVLIATVAAFQAAMAASMLAGTAPPAVDAYWGARASAERQLLAFAVPCALRLCVSAALFARLGVHWRRPDAVLRAAWLAVGCVTLLSACSKLDHAVAILAAATHARTAQRLPPPPHLLVGFSCALVCAYGCLALAVLHEPTRARLQARLAVLIGASSGAAPLAPFVGYGSLGGPRLPSELVRAAGATFEAVVLDARALAAAEEEAEAEEACGRAGGLGDGRGLFGHTRLSPQATVAAAAAVCAACQVDAGARRAASGGAGGGALGRPAALVPSCVGLFLPGSARGGGGGGGGGGRAAATARKASSRASSTATAATDLSSSAATSRRCSDAPSRRASSRLPSAGRSRRRSAEADGGAEGGGGEGAEAEAERGSAAACAAWSEEEGSPAHPRAAADGAHAEAGAAAPASAPSAEPPTPRADAFVLHAPGGSSRAKLRALRVWACAHARTRDAPPRVLIDQLCAQPTPSAAHERLQHALPHLARCERLLVLAAPGLMEELWCSSVLFLWLALGGRLDDVDVVYACCADGEEDEDDDADADGGAEASAARADGGAHAAPASAARPRHRRAVQDVIAAVDSFHVMHTEHGAAHANPASVGATLMHAVELAGVSRYNHTVREFLPLIARAGQHALEASAQPPARTAGPPPTGRGHGEAGAALDQTSGGSPPDGDGGGASSGIQLAVPAGRHAAHQWQ